MCLNFILVAYDDCLPIVCMQKDTATILEIDLRKLFIFKDLRRASAFIAVAIDYDDKKGIMTLSQADAIMRCLKRFNMALCKAVSKRMYKIVSALLKVNAESAHDVPYREGIGSLLYSSIITMPDNLYVLSNLA